MLKPIIDSLAFNPTIFLANIVMFVILWNVMSVLFWKPILAHLAAREQSITGSYATVAETQREMEALRADYLARIAQVEAEARARIQAAIKEAQTERERLMAEARAQSDAAIREGVAAMEREKTEALQQLRDHMVGLAVVAAGKALGPAADPASLRRSIEESLHRSASGGADPSRN
ncbi:MAG TPA: ATP synthase F0 subunit B [Chthonomonadaceae bacterium]|jgi:F-type H+-transporting ATPase subunit b|nr:ATP synthase F0 subunit B [Chthonomonadaceae bacterium]